MERYDAVVVGGGPNGLAAAITLAQAGRSVLVIEAAATVGGGTRTAELTLPGFRHDVCSAVHPFAAASPFFRTLPLEEHGLRWLRPVVPVAHAVTADRVAILPADLDEAVDRLGPGYGTVMRRTIANWPSLEEHIFGPLPRIPRRPLPLAAFGLDGAVPAAVAARRFADEESRALFAGCAAHAFLPLEKPMTAAFGWFLMVGAHLSGWPVAAGGSQAIADALASHLRSLGGEIRTGWRVETIEELPPRSITMLDLTPGGVVALAGHKLPGGYLRRAKAYRHGPAAFKVDYALSGPVPWTHPDLARAGTVHLSGTLAEVAGAERSTWEGEPAARPFLLVAQQSAVDPSRAPAGSHTLWVYAHVPHGSNLDVTGHIDQRLEEMAPGFGELVIGRHVMTPADLEAYNPNYRGGDIAGGAHTLGQLVFRPFLRANPYTTPLDGVFLCSASTPPGAGTHGMCGHRAALAALAR